ncbi:quercetin dioxygenase-like cupin family protein [Comamonas sp. BIGb0152]|uniref:(R)-mandelonitrile lyase n=1 Tax=Comamonas sp. BIGb0152 TaxID=2940601 RepID=UPI002168092E|nr:cupin domain-containing protein [Comamonas sp. BIGb0152]MCS4291820.1 quercetin dioxygenase-like cupin family protein [Comamonas sp. BIGb0152]
MGKRLIAAGASVLISTSMAQAQGIPISPAGTPTTMIGAAQNFSGHVAVDIKAAGDSAQQGSVGMVDFAPGARTAWHTHPAGQLLVVTDGKGWIQQDGQPRQNIQAGDVVWIDADVRHWHGAATTTGMRHLAVTYLKNGKNADWKELVSDAQYNPH